MTEKEIVDIVLKVVPIMLQATTLLYKIRKDSKDSKRQKRKRNTASSKHAKHMKKR